MAFLAHPCFFVGLGNRFFPIVFIFFLSPNEGDKKKKTSGGGGGGT